MFDFVEVFNHFQIFDWFFWVFRENISSFEKYFDVKYWQYSGNFVVSFSKGIF